ncbi:MAG: hypothetical protein WDN30_08385 [Pararobbsia sp.]
MVIIRIFAALPPRAASLRGRSAALARVLGVVTVGLLCAPGRRPRDARPGAEHHRNRSAELRRDAERAR